MVVIADIAGQYDALLRLTSKFVGRKIVLLGDLCDRGPQSKQVIEWAMNNPDVTSLMGNHEHMFIDWYHSMLEADYQSMYHSEDFFRNGGLATLRSYGRDSYASGMQAAWAVDPKHIIWLESRPLSFESDGIFCSHAPWLQDEKSSQFDRLWNRDFPHKMAGKVQIFGHNAHWGLKIFSDEKEPLWAMCLDQSRRGVLTAFDCDSGEIYDEPYEISRPTESGLH